MHGLFSLLDTGAPYAWGNLIPPKGERRVLERSKGSRGSGSLSLCSLTCVVPGLPISLICTRGRQKREPQPLPPCGGQPAQPRRPSTTPPGPPLRRRGGRGWGTLGAGKERLRPSPKLPWQRPKAAGRVEDGRSCARTRPRPQGGPAPNKAPPRRRFRASVPGYCGLRGALIPSVPDRLPLTGRLCLSDHGRHHCLIIRVCLAVSD